MTAPRKKLVATACATALAVAVAAGPAHATPPRPVTIALHGHLTGPDSVAGTWESSGAFGDSGTYTEQVRFAAPRIGGLSIHVEKRLDGARGALVIRADAHVLWLTPSFAEFSGGSWRVSAGTGAYADLHAEGTPAVTPGSFGDLVSHTVEVEHAGLVH